MLYESSFYFGEWISGGHLSESFGDWLVFDREKEMPIFYRDEHIGTRRVDFFVEGLVILELKATSKLEDAHKAQAINYCEAYNIADGLLINFGGLSLEFKRVFNKKLVTPTRF